MAGGADPPFPPAEGVRLPWSALPAGLRAEVARRLGAPVVEASTCRGGFSPAVAAVVRTADDRTWFMKAASRSVNSESVRIYRREAAVAAALPRSPLLPELLWSLDDGEWALLAFAHVDGAMPRLPWRHQELDRVLGALADLADTLTPAPIAVETAGRVHGEMLMQWRALVGHTDAARLPPPWHARLAELVALEAAWPEAVAGETLVHFDVRADNVLLSPGRVCFVDWPWAARGARWVDLVTFLPSVAMQGGPDPEDVWRASPLARGVDAEAVDCHLAGLAGMFTRASMQPPSPGLPTLRAFQAAQGRTARRWLAQRRGWADALEV